MFTETELPVAGGVELTVGCGVGYTNTGGNRAKCQDGQIVEIDNPQDCQLELG